VERYRLSSAICAAIVTVSTGIWGVVGCAQGSVAFEGTGGSSSTSGTGGSTSSGGGEGGTTSGSGGEGGSSPCAVDCSQIQAPQCQVAQCNAQTGQCEVVADGDGTGCDDGLFCSAGDECLAGVCEPGPANDCGMSVVACAAITCDESSQTCTSVPSQNGDPCIDPNDLCVENGTCLNGTCSGTQKDCFMQPVPDDCHVSECNSQSGQCEPVPGNEGNACADLNDLCTVNKTCAAGVCQGGNPKDCTQLTQGCVMGVCDVNTGQCTTQNLNNGDPCDDLDGCTVGEICQNGGCSGGTGITQCIHSDGCCPNSCTINNDDDCHLCGNNTLEQDEELDPPPGPSSSVPLDTNTCRYDFSSINQLYCNGSCGNWNNSAAGCDQIDADVLCKLKMDNPNSTATSFQTGTATAAPGVCCPPPTWQPGNGGCVDLGVLSSRGVTTNVSVHDTSVLSTHGGGTVVMGVQCTNP
jgi:hypothetical protein